MSKTFQLIIFDLDGTLVNSQYDIADATNYALAQLNRPLITYAEIPAMVGSGIRKLLEIALGKFTAEELKEARQHFDHHYALNYTNKTKCYPEVEETLVHFKNIKKAVYSNKVHPYTVEIVTKLGLKPQFDLVMGARFDQYKPKPSPEGIHLILDTLKVKAKDAIMIGDSTHDIHAAQAAGLTTCAVTYGYRPIETLMEANPDFVIERMGDLKKYVKN